MAESERTPSVTAVKGIVTPTPSVEAYLTTISGAPLLGKGMERRSQIDRTATRRIEVMTQSREAPAGSTITMLSHYPDGTVALTIMRGQQQLASLYIRPDLDSLVQSGEQAPIEATLPEHTPVVWAKGV